MFLQLYLCKSIDKNRSLVSCKLLLLPSTMVLNWSRAIYGTSLEFLVYESILFWLILVPMGNVPILNYPFLNHQDTSRHTSFAPRALRIGGSTFKSPPLESGGSIDWKTARIFYPGPQARYRQQNHP